jgi:putative phage-type endonuclease
MLQTATRPTYHFDIEQGTDEWLAMRRGVITASTIGILLTSTGKVANNDASRNQLFKLLAERLTGESEPSFYNDDMQRGHLLEPPARALYAEHFDPVQECGFVTARFDIATIGYSPDGLVGDDGLIEIKSPREKKHLKTLLSGEVPADHMAQIQTGLAVTGRRWLDFISYAPGLPLFVQRCARDETVIAQLIAAAEAAEDQLQILMQDFAVAAAKFPATDPIQPEQEIVI